MRFDEIVLDDRQAAFADDIARFFANHAGPAVLEEEERTGDGFNESLHLAMGRRGWVLDHWPAEEGGAALDSIERRLLALGKERSGLPFTTLDTTRLVADAVRRHAQPSERSRLMLGAARGEIRFCLGYTEPQGGSDVADARTRAVARDTGWVVTGSKLFTTGAHNCQYAFTIVRTSSNGSKHAGLTMLLVPLDATGVEVRPIRTFGGERTNVVYFDEVYVPDALRIGDVNDGWSVLHDRLDAEHGLDSDGVDGLRAPSVRTPYAILLARCVDAVHEWLAAALDPIGEGSRGDDLRYRLGLVAMEAEAALSSPGHYGRIIASTALINGTQELFAMLASEVIASEECIGTEADAAARLIEFADRFAQGTATYGGTVEVFRNIIAHNDLGLPRPTYPG